MQTLSEAILYPAKACSLHKDCAGLSKRLAKFHSVEHLAKIKSYLWLRIVCRHTVNLDVKKTCKRLLKGVPGAVNLKSP